MCHGGIGIHERLLDADEQLRCWDRVAMFQGEMADVDFLERSSAECRLHKVSVQCLFYTADVVEQRRITSAASDKVVQILDRRLVIAGKREHALHCQKVPNAAEGLFWASHVYLDPRISRSGQVRRKLSSGVLNLRRVCLDVISQQRQLIQDARLKLDITVHFDETIDCLVDNLPAGLPGKRSFHARVEVNLCVHTIHVPVQVEAKGQLRPMANFF